MKQTKRFSAIFIIVVFFTGFAFAQKQNFPSKPKDGQTEMVDTRVDNMGYWRKLAEQGTSTLLITSEIEEMVGLSDRVLVLKEGSIVADLKGQDINNAMLMQMSLGEIYSDE